MPVVLTLRLSLAYGGMWLVFRVVSEHNFVKLKSIPIQTIHANKIANLSLILLFR